MLNNPEAVVQSLKRKFLLKGRLFAIWYWMLSLGLLLTTLVLSLLSAMISTDLIQSPHNYAFSVLAISATTSLISAALSFFLLRKRCLKNQLLLEFINLETIIYHNRDGIYGKVSDPGALLLDRIYQKLGVVSILKDYDGISSWTKN